MANNKEEAIVCEGRISRILAGSMFRVMLDNGIEVLGLLSGKMRKFNITLAIGDRVKMEFSPYDLTKGRISYRFKE